MDDKPVLCTIYELLCEQHYTIPVFQRNYAWRKEEIAQLVTDIAWHILEPVHRIYYTGTLVVATSLLKDKATCETIDGQQRLTTLNILACILKNEYGVGELDNWVALNLDFASRPSSANTLRALFEKHQFEEANYNSAIANGYTHAYSALRSVLKETGCTVSEFANTMLHRVKMLRITVPQNTDLNHYFEIMNTRGEQLEKHEILKARCLDQLKYDPLSSKVFSGIWDACADMDRYVQYNFNKSWRDILFAGAHNYRLNFLKFDRLAKALKPYLLWKDESKDFTSILEQPQASPEGTADIDDAGEKWLSIIDFPNFLLHVLRVHVLDDIPLDDKQLITVFTERIGQGGATFVKNFGLHLLRLRTLFDRYVIRRDDTESNQEWSLRQLTYYKQNTVYKTTFGDQTGKLIMLQSMFHVSAPARIYKHWLAAVLNYVDQGRAVTADGFVLYLERLALAYLVDRFLTAQPTSYYNIVVTNNAMPVNSDPDPAFLRYGAVENYVFNYLDYLLWAQPGSAHSWFQFKNKSSVEHFYPQIDQGKGMDEEYLHHFGNLCLISGSQNSRLNDRLPEQKRLYYLEKANIESIKQKLMLNYPGIWDQDAIEKHGDEMQRILLGSSCSGNLKSTPQLSE